MKENFIHVCFVIDESGSMGLSTNDVLGGFKRVIDEQRAVQDGTCAVSLFKFASKVQEIYRGKDVSEVPYLDTSTYCPGGMTAMNDGIGTAIDTIGTWLSGMPEEERPEKNLIVIMTDGEENASQEYSFEKVREMIERQEKEWNWTFMYLGTDVSKMTAESARSLGITNVAASTRSNLTDNYLTINSIVSRYRSCTGDALAKSAVLDNSIRAAVSDINTKYCAETGIDLSGEENEKDA